MSARSTRVPARPGKRLLAHDRAIGRFVAGVDEAGRGALAGPIVAAAVVLDTTRLTGPEAAALGRLDDSKRLAADLRARLYDVVLARAQSIALVAISASTIDAVGLHRCNIDAMRRALQALVGPIDAILVDGFQLDPIRRAADADDIACRRLVKGDQISAAVAAGAIVAKVTRDRLLQRLDEETQGRWALSEHHGYATATHAERISLHGISHHHRHSYDAMAYVGAPVSDLPSPGTRTSWHLRSDADG